VNAITETGTLAGNAMGSAGFLARYEASKGRLPGDSALRAAARELPRGGRATEFGRGAPRLPAETQLRIPRGPIPGVRTGKE